MTAAIFQHSVASGDPLQDRVVLWTRVTTDAADPVELTWRVARDRELRDVVREGTTTSDPDADHTVHVDADGLDPATTYYFGFESGGAASPVARTRTLPAPNKLLSCVSSACRRFASACQPFAATKA